MCGVRLGNAPVGVAQSGSAQRVSVVRGACGGAGGVAGDDRASCACAGGVAFSGGARVYCEREGVLHAQKTPSPIPRTHSESSFAEMPSMQAQIQLQRMQIEALRLARTREEKARAALEALRDLVSSEHYEVIREILGVELGE